MISSRIALFLVASLLIAGPDVAAFAASAHLTTSESAAGKMANEDVPSGPVQQRDPASVPGLTADQASVVKGVWYPSNSSSVTDHGVSSVAGSIAWVLAGIGSSKPAQVFLSPGNYAIGTDLSIASNVVVSFSDGATLRIAAGRTVTFNSPAQILAASSAQLFSGGGKVHFTDPGTVHTAWWGAVGDGKTDSSPAITAACASLPDANFVYWHPVAGTVKLGTGDYRITSPVHCSRNGLIFEGESIASTRISAPAVLSGSAALIFTRRLYNDSWYGERGGGRTSYGMMGQVRIRKFQLMLESPTASGIYVGPGENQWVEDVWILGTGKSLKPSNYGIYFDGNHYPMWTSHAFVDRARMGGFHIGIRSGGLAGVTDSIIEGCDYGISCKQSEDTACGIGIVKNTYIQNCGYGILNTGSNGMVIGCNFEANLIKDYDDNNTKQAHNSLLFNTWTLDPVTYLPTKLSVNRNSSILDRWHQNQLAGIRNAGMLDLYSNGAAEHGPSLNLHMSGVEFGTDPGYAVLGLNTYWGGHRGTIDAFGHTVDASHTRTTISSYTNRLDIGTRGATQWPVNILTGSALRAEFGDDNITFNLEYGEGAHQLDFHSWKGTDPDSWGLTGSDHASPWGPIHSIISRTTGLRIGPGGPERVPHHLWYTAFMGHDDDAARWYPVMTVNGLGVHINSRNIPKSAAAPCYTGQFAWDTDYIYVCVAPNTWKRATLSTW